MLHVRVFPLLLSCSLLGAPLPLPALTEEIITNISLLEAQGITPNSDAAYIDLSREWSNIAEIISQLSNLDEHSDSLLHSLHKHIEHGFCFAEYNAVIETLEYAEIILQKNYTQLDTVYAEKITADLNEIIDNVINGSLTRRPTLVINENIDVLGQSTFEKHVRTKQGIHVSGKLKVGKSAKFENNVTINGILAASDATIGNLSVSGTVSAADAVIENLIVTDCMNNLCVDNLSVVDAVVGNLSVSGTVSLTDAVVNNLIVNDCMNNLCVNSLSVSDIVIASCIDTLCVNHLSVVDAVIIELFVGGHSLSATDAVITNATATNFSSADAVITNLSLTDLVVASCIDSLCVNNFTVTEVTILSCIDAVCVNNLSVAEVIITDIFAYSLSATDAVLENVTATNFSSTDAIITNLTVVSLDSVGLVHNDASGVLSSSLLMNADITVGTIANNKLATISSAGIPGSIVVLDESGNFSVNDITITGPITDPTDAATKSYVDSVVIVATGTNLNMPNTIVKRDNTGSFAAQEISMNDGILAGNLILTTEPSTSTAGNITKNGLSFIHNFGTSNTFVGVNAGNFTTSGTGQNSAFGTNALVSVTTGSNNIAIGYQAAQGLTTGSNNIYLNASAGSSAESNTTRIGTAQTECFIAGIAGVGISGNVVTINTNGQLGITLSSRRFKHDIHNMGDISENILKFRPVTFVYNNDATENTTFGLIAEEVEELLPEIVSKDADGVPYTVRYDLLPVLLLNELQKQRVIIETQQTVIEEMNNAINSIKKELREYCTKTIA